MESSLRQSAFLFSGSITQSNAIEADGKGEPVYRRRSRWASLKPPESDELADTSRNYPSSPSSKSSSPASSSKSSEASSSEASSELSPRSSA